MKYELLSPIDWKVSELQTVWMGVCDTLGLTVIGHTQEDLYNELTMSTHEACRDLHEDDQLEEVFLIKGLRFQVSGTGEFEGIKVTIRCLPASSAAEEKLAHIVSNVERIIGQEDMDLLDTRCAIRALLASYWP